MILHRISQLSQCHLVLASASPRRAELLRSIGLNPEIVASSFAEDLDCSSFATPGDYAEETARHKVEYVARNMTKGRDKGKRRIDFYIAADTVVEINGRLLEKPKDRQEAFEMLQLLSGKQHSVYTGVALLIPPSADQNSEQSSEVLRCFQERTLVEFGDVDKDTAWAYVATGEPMDKAGAYGIQGLGGLLVKGIHGCYYNVMGLPLHRLSVELEDLFAKKLLQLPEAEGLGFLPEAGVQVEA